MGRRQVPQFEPVFPVKLASVHERPCGPAEGVLTPPPPSDETSDVVIQSRQPLSQHPAEIVPSPSDVEVQFLEQLLQVEPRPSGLLPQLAADPSLRFLPDVEVQLASPPEVRVA